MGRIIPWGRRTGLDNIVPRRYNVVGKRESKAAILLEIYSKEQRTPTVADTSF